MTEGGETTRASRPDIPECYITKSGHEPVYCVNQQFLLLSEKLSASHYPGAANIVTSNGSFSIMRLHHPWLGAGEASCNVGSYQGARAHLPATQW